MCFYNITYFSFVCLHVLHVHVKQVNLCRLSSFVVFFFFFFFLAAVCDMQDLSSPSSGGWEP